MIRRLRRVAPLQLGKILALTYGLGALLFLPFVGLFALVATLAPKMHGPPGPPLGAMIGMAVGFLVLVPLFYALMGFLTGVIGAFVYNLVASWIGGIEFEVD